jgi:hypothetical protein
MKKKFFGIEIEIVLSPLIVEELLKMKNIPEDTRKQISLLISERGRNEEDNFNYIPFIRALRFLN